MPTVYGQLLSVPYIEFIIFIVATMSVLNFDVAVVGLFISCCVHLQGLASWACTQPTGWQRLARS